MEDILKLGRDTFLWLFGGAGLVALGAAYRFFRTRRASSGTPPTPQVVAPTLDQLKARSKILVIDDQTFDYKKPLEQEGFNVEWRRDIKSTVDIEQGEFDVVLLDLHGVATSLSTRQGIGVLDRVKRASPAQMIIAYSAASWPVTESRDAEIADEILDKARATYPDFRDSVTRLLVSSATPAHYIAALEGLCTHSLDHLLHRRLEMLKSEIRTALLQYVKSGDRVDLAALEAALRERGLEDKAVPQLHAIANLARRRLSQWIA